MILAPAPRLASFAASLVSSGTKPLVTIRSPPAAEEQAKVSVYSSFPVFSSRRARPLVRPSLMSVCTVV